MFQDLASTTPVTTPGQPVGRRLDKSGRGNHATAPTLAARPIYGVEPKGGRRNLLTWSEDFRTTAQAGGTRPWVGAGGTITADQDSAPDGTTTADRMVTGAGGSSLKAIYAVLDLAASTHTFSAYVKDNGSTARSVAIFFATPTLSATVGTAYNFDTDTLTNNPNAAPFTFVASSRTSVGSGWFRLSIAVTVASAQTVRPYISAPFSIAQAGDYLIWGAQLELGSTATNYQRVTTEFDVTEAGVATCHYCRYDGNNNSMSTAAIDFTATNKMSVFAGVRKLSDAAAGIFVETSSNWTENAGTFIITAPSGTGLSTYGFSARGSGATHPSVTATAAAPIASVISTLADIPADTRTIRLNGSVASSVTNLDLGTGNFGNWPLFIGRRNNAGTFNFNGRDYGIIIVGKAASAGEITDTETWLAAKTPQVTL